MADLASYLGVTIIGYFFGSKLRSKRDSLRLTERSRLSHNPSCAVYGSQNGR